MRCADDGFRHGSLRKDPGQERQLLHEIVRPISALLEQHGITGQDLKFLETIAPPAILMLLAHHSSVRADQEDAFCMGLAGEATGGPLDMPGGVCPADSGTHFRCTQRRIRELSLVWHVRSRDLRLRAKTRDISWTRRFGVSYRQRCGRSDELPIVG